MLPDIHRRSPRTPAAAPSPQPRAFDFDGEDERKSIFSKKMLGILAGISVSVVIIVFFSMTSSTTSELQSENIPAQVKQNNVPAPDPRHHPPSPAVAHHDENGAVDILTRLKGRLDTNKFSPGDYRKMTQKVKEMYPGEEIPEDLIVNPAPDVNPVEDELDLGHIQNRRGKLKNLAHNMCLSRVRPFEVELCDDALEFYFDGSMGRLQLLDNASPPHCLEARVHGVHEGELWTYPCHSDGGNQKWVYNPYTHQLKHLHGLCLAASPSRDPDMKPMASVLPCDERLATEMWVFEHESS